MGEQILVWVFGIIAIAEEKLEKMEEAEEIESMNCALPNNQCFPSHEATDIETHIHQGRSCLTTNSVIII